MWRSGIVIIESNSFCQHYSAFTAHILFYPRSSWRIEYACPKLLSNLSITPVTVICCLEPSNYLIQHYPTFVDWSVGFHTLHQWHLLCCFGKFLLIGTSSCPQYSFLCIVVAFFFKLWRIVMLLTTKFNGSLLLNSDAI